MMISPIMMCPMDMVTLEIYKNFRRQVLLMLPSIRKREWKTLSYPKLVMSLCGLHVQGLDRNRWAEV